jgi:hypothetical protein
MIMNTIRYEQALDSHDEKEWRTAIEEEYSRMEENEVYSCVKI